jgi:GT2 family glycosyltransferase
MNLNNLWNRKKTASIVIPCRNEGKYLKLTLDSLMSSKTYLDYEIIVVNDGSSDGCCDFLLARNYDKIRKIDSKNLGVAKAKNLGAKEAYGEYLFFCDAHVFVQDWWLDTLTNSMRYYNAHGIAPGIREMVRFIQAPSESESESESTDRDRDRDRDKNVNANANANISANVGYGETWDEQLNCCWFTDYQNRVAEIPIAPGGFFGISKRIFQQIGGFERNFKIWGREDEEISLRLWLFGYKIIVDGNVEVEHLFKIKNEYGVTSYEAMYNLLFMALLHFEVENLTKVIQIKKHQVQFSQCFSELLLNRELIKKREYYLANRIYNEKYLFEKFNIKLRLVDLL